MRALAALIAFTSLASTSLHAQQLEDVIYKTDGSVLRGELIEQDFAAGKYKIQLLGGSVFSVSRDDISKITREAPLASAKTVKSEPTPTVNVEVTQSGISNSNTAAPVQPSMPETTASTVTSNGHYAIPRSLKDTSVPPHVISVGTNSRGYTVELGGYTTEELYYEGFNIAYQANFTDHFSVYVDYSKGNFDRERFEDNSSGFFQPGPELENSKATAIQALGVLSTGNGRNQWQGAIGAGVFTETLIYDSYSDDADGTVWMMAGGYSFENLQLQLRYFGYDSKDYSDAVEDAYGISFQLGWNI